MVQRPNGTRRPVSQVDLIQGFTSKARAGWGRAESESGGANEGQPRTPHIRYTCCSGSPVCVTFIFLPTGQRRGRKFPAAQLGKTSHLQNFRAGQCHPVQLTLLVAGFWVCPLGPASCLVWLRKTRVNKIIIQITRAVSLAEHL